jgi:acetolactate synthase small subunit
MQSFEIRYRNTQGTLMRILNAASRRGIDMPFLQAGSLGHVHCVTLELEVSPKQVGQLRRDWQAIVDVTDVRAHVLSAAQHALAAEWAAAPHPPTSERAAELRSAGASA